MNQYKTPRQLSTTRIFFRTTSTVPNQPRPFLANPNLLSQPLQTTDVITHHSRTTMDQFAQLLYSFLLCENGCKNIFTISLMSSLPLNGFPSTSLSALILYPCLILLCSSRTWRMFHFPLDNFYKFVPIRHIEANFREKVAWGKSWSSGVVL